jgi:glucokinase
LETVASASGLSRGYQRLTGRMLAASEVADRARSGEPAAAQAFVLVTEALAEALDTAVTLLAPELIVIGGGLSGALDLFVEPLSRRLDAGLTFQRPPRLAAALLGADAGVIGAGILGWRQFGALSA